MKYDIVNGSNRLKITESEKHFLDIIDNPNLLKFEGLEIDSKTQISRKDGHLYIPAVVKGKKYTLCIKDDRLIVSSDDMKISLEFDKNGNLINKDEVIKNDKVDSDDINNQDVLDKSKTKKEKMTLGEIYNNALSIFKLVTHDANQKRENPKLIFNIALFSFF